jgi:hypothetical protein
MKNTAIIILAFVLVVLLIIGIKVALTILKIFLVGAIFGIAIFSIAVAIYNKKEK